MSENNNQDMPVITEECSRNIELVQPQNVTKQFSRQISNSEVVVDDNTKNVVEEVHNEKFQLKDNQVLSHIVHSNIQTTINENVKQEVLIQTLQAKLKKLRNIKKDYASKITVLKEKDISLNQELTNELAYCSKIEREYHNTRLMINMLADHLSKIQNEYNALLTSKKQINSEIERHMSKFQTNTDKISHDIAKVRSLNESLKTQLAEQQKEYLIASQNADSEIACQENKILFLKNELRNKVEEYEQLRNDSITIKKSQIEYQELKDVLENVLRNNREMTERRLKLKSEHDKKVANTKADIIQLITTIEDMKTKEGEIQEEISKEISKTIELEEKYRTLQETLETQQKENNEIQLQREFAEQDHIIACNALTEKCKEIRLEIDELDKNYLNYAYEAAATSQKVQETYNDYKICATKSASLKTELNALTDDASSKREMLSKYNIETTKLTNDRENLRALHEKLQDEYVSAKRKNEEVLNEFHKTIENLNNQKTIKESDYQNKLLSLNRAKEEFELECEKRISDIQQKVENLNNEISKVNEAVQVEQNKKNKLSNLRRIKEERLKKLIAEKERQQSEKERLLKELDKLTKPHGILKSPKKIQSIAKHVSFNHNLKWESSDTSVDESVTNSNVKPNPEMLWDDVTRKANSPPEKL